MDCPICKKSGLPDFYKSRVVCPQCNSDLYSFTLIGESNKLYLKERRKSLLLLAILSVVVIALIFSLYRIFFIKKSRKVFSYLVFFYAWSFVPWILSPRILFYYHYTPALPFLATMLAVLVKKIYFTYNKKIGFWSSSINISLFMFTIFSLVGIFWIYYSGWIGFLVPRDFKEIVYF